MLNLALRRGHAAGCAHSDEPTSQLDPHRGEHVFATRCASSTRSSVSRSCCPSSGWRSAQAAGRPPSSCSSRAAAAGAAAGDGGRGAWSCDLFLPCSTAARIAAALGAPGYLPPSCARGGIPGIMRSIRCWRRKVLPTQEQPVLARARRWLSFATRRTRRGRAARFFTRIALGLVLRAHRQQRRRQDDGARCVLRGAAAISRQRVS